MYHIQYKDCHNNYIGETGRNLGVRFKEHTARKGVNSAMKEHPNNCGHSCTLDNVKILDKEDHWYRRKIKEAIMIQRHHLPLNLDQGLKLPPVFCRSNPMTLASHVRTQTHNNATEEARCTLKNKCCP